MNLRRRTLQTVYIARPAALQGSMGGIGEGFAPAHQVMQGQLLPCSGKAKEIPAGKLFSEQMTLLLPRSADLRAGDGVGFAADAMTYRVTHCQRYPLHLCAQLERLLP